MAQITAPPEYWPYYLETYDKTEADVEASFQESCQEKMSDWQSVYGSDVTISYRIVGLSRPDENGLEEWNQNRHFPAAPKRARKPSIPPWPKWATAGISWRPITKNSRTPLVSPTAAPSLNA